MATARLFRTSPSKSKPHKFFDYRNQQLKDGDPEIFSKINPLYDYPKDVTVEVDFSSNYLGRRAAQLLANWLTSGCAPSEVILHLSANEFDDEAAKILATAARHEKSPLKLTLNLGTNKLTDVAAKYLATTVLARRYFDLSVAENFLTESGAKKLEFAKGDKAKDIKIDLRGNILKSVRVEEGAVTGENHRHLPHVSTRRLA